MIQVRDDRSIDRDHRVSVTFARISTVCISEPLIRRHLVNVRFERALSTSLWTTIAEAFVRFRSSPPPPRRITAEYRDSFVVFFRYYFWKRKYTLKQDRLQGARWTWRRSRRPLRYCVVRSVSCDYYCICICWTRGECLGENECSSDTAVDGIGAKLVMGYFSSLDRSRFSGPNIRMYIEWKGDYYNNPRNVLLGFAKMKKYVILLYN